MIRPPPPARRATSAVRCRGSRTKPMRRRRPSGHGGRTIRTPRRSHGRGSDPGAADGVARSFVAVSPTRTADECRPPATSRATTCKPLSPPASRSCRVWSRGGASSREEAGHSPNTGAPPLVALPIATHPRPSSGPSASGRPGGSCASPGGRGYPHRPGLPRVTCVRPSRQGPLVRGRLRGAGVGRGGAPAAKRGRTTLTNPRAGADSLWAGRRGGGALRYLVLDEAGVVGDNNRDGVSPVRW